MHSHVKIWLGDLFRLIMDENQNQNSSEEPKEDRSSRAKAFFRQMYAGSEPDPDAFGIDLGQKAPQADAQTVAALALCETQLKESEAKALENENLYKRLAADFENYRKRVDREREEFQAIGMQKAIEAILPALDDLDMAQSKLTEKTESKVMLESLKMVFNRLNRCLETIGIKQMDVIGQPFDPRLHEPVQEIPTNDVPEGAVVHQLRAGYTFKEKVIRPSLVNVATALSAEAAEAHAAAAAAKAASQALEEPQAQPAPLEETAAQVADAPLESAFAEAAAQTETAAEAPAQAENAIADTSFAKSSDLGEEKQASPTAEEVVKNSGVETCDTLEALDVLTNRSTQDLPLEEIKAALAEAEAREREEAALSKEGKIYDISEEDI